MQVSLTIIRYPKIFIPFAIPAMALFRLPLSRNKNISFYKLFGSGRNGTFDKVPDIRQWAILTVRNSGLAVNAENDQQQVHKHLYGYFITSWLKFFSCESWTIIIEPVSGYGLWDGKEVFGTLPRHADINGPLAILTRATIRLSKLGRFWKHVAPVAARLTTAKGFIGSVGIGEIPWIKLATFSTWTDAESMTAFAYQADEHTAAITETREQQLFKEEMFVRFRIVFHTGTLKGKDPLAGNL